MYNRTYHLPLSDRPEPAPGRRPFQGMTISVKQWLLLTGLVLFLLAAAGKSLTYAVPLAAIAILKMVKEALSWTTFKICIESIESLTRQVHDDLWLR